MGTFLFDQIIFGPVFSRRLGQSLGINLLPIGKKICTFNCVYCECGWTDHNTARFVSLEDYEQALAAKLMDMNSKHEIADHLTFAGNGEPTLHPHFDDIMNITIRLRNTFMPEAAIAVLSNSTTLHHAHVFSALSKADKNIMKLDTGSEKMFQLINQPNNNVTLEEIITGLEKFKGNCIIQTLLVKGTSIKGEIDNSTESELQLLASHLQRIKPHTLMLYSISRGTPLESLVALHQDELQHAAHYLKSKLTNCSVEIY
jgi:wyosine [tRNA(Phe)-imidazoG37] synthetase (radical SAM superfamily)